MGAAAVVADALGPPVDGGVVAAEIGQGGGRGDGGHGLALGRAAPALAGSAAR